MFKPKTKKLAEGGIIKHSGSPFTVKSAKMLDNVEERRNEPKDDDINETVPMEKAEDDRQPMAEGGEITPQEEEQIEKHASIAAAIMAKRRMANGGVVDEVVPEHADDKDLADGQVDIDDNGKEMPNPMDKRNHEILSDNLDEDMMDVEQPEDSNTQGPNVDNVKHSIADRIRAKLRKSPMVK
jgi:hypothetical protein